MFNNQAKNLKPGGKANLIITHFRCHECDLVFNHVSSLTRHVQIHFGAFQCTRNDCDKSFSSHKHLWTHLKRHSTLPINPIDNLPNITVLRICKRNKINGDSTITAPTPNIIASVGSSSVQSATSPIAENATVQPFVESLVNSNKPNTEIDISTFSENNSHERLVNEIMNLKHQILILQTENDMLKLKFLNKNEAKSTNLSQDDPELNSHEDFEILETESSNLGELPISIETPLTTTIEPVLKRALDHVHHDTFQLNDPNGPIKMRIFKCNRGWKVSSFGSQQEPDLSDSTVSNSIRFNLNEDIVTSFEHPQQVEQINLAPDYQGSTIEDQSTSSVASTHILDKSNPFLYELINPKASNVYKPIISNASMITGQYVSDESSEEDSVIDMDDSSTSRDDTATCISHSETSISSFVNDQHYKCDTSKTINDQTIAADEPITSSSCNKTSFVVYLPVTIAPMSNQLPPSLQSVISDNDEAMDIQTKQFGKPDESESQMSVKASTLPNCEFNWSQVELHQLDGITENQHSLPFTNVHSVPSIKTPITIKSLDPIATSDIAPPPLQDQQQYEQLLPSQSWLQFPDYDDDDYAPFKTEFVNSLIKFNCDLVSQSDNVKMQSLDPIELNSFTTGEMNQNIQVIENDVLLEMNENIPMPETQIVSSKSFNSLKSCKNDLQALSCSSSSNADTLTIQSLDTVAQKSSPSSASLPFTSYVILESPESSSINSNSGFMQQSNDSIKYSTSSPSSLHSISHVSHSFSSSASINSTMNKSFKCDRKCALSEGIDVTIETEHSKSGDNLLTLIEASSAGPTSTNPIQRNPILFAMLQNNVDYRVASNESVVNVEDEAMVVDNVEKSIGQQQSFLSPLCADVRLFDSNEPNKDMSTQSPQSLNSTPPISTEYSQSSLINSPLDEFKCDRECDSLFTKKINLTRHFQEHTEIPTHRCEWNECNKSFIHRHQLIEHINRHIDELNDT